MTVSAPQIVDHCSFSTSCIMWERGGYNRMMMIGGDDDDDGDSEMAAMVKTTTVAGFRLCAAWCGAVVEMVGGGGGGGGGQQGIQFSGQRSGAGAPCAREEGRRSGVVETGCVKAVQGQSGIKPPRCCS